MKSRMQISRSCCQDYFLCYTKEFVFDLFGNNEYFEHRYPEITSLFFGAGSAYSQPPTINESLYTRNNRTLRALDSTDQSEAAQATVAELGFSNILFMFPYMAPFVSNPNDINPADFMIETLLTPLRIWLENGGKIIWMWDFYLGTTYATGIDRRYEHYNEVLSGLGSTIQFEEINPSFYTDLSGLNVFNTQKIIYDNLTMLSNPPIISDWSSSDVDFLKWADVNYTAGDIPFQHNKMIDVLTHQVQLTGGTMLFSQDFTASTNTFMGGVIYEEDFTQNICAIERIGNGAILLLPYSPRTSPLVTTSNVNGSFSIAMVDRMVNRSVDDLI